MGGSEDAARGGKADAAHSATAGPGRRPWLGRLDARILIPCLAMLLTAPSLGTELLRDDYIHAELIDKRLSGNGGPDPWWDIFRWATGGPEVGLRERTDGTRPWWSTLDVHIQFLRPVTAATHYLDYGLWPRAHWAMHLQSVLWYGFACLMVVLVGLRLTSSRAVAVLGGLLYAVDDAHIGPAGWLAARNATMSSAFALLALYLHDRATRDGLVAGRWLAPLCLLAALLSGETAVAIVPIFVLLRLLRSGPVRPWLRSLLPVVGTFVVWVLAYRGLGYGVRGSAGYLDPFDEPGLFVAHLLPRIRELLTQHFGASLALFESIGGAVFTLREVGILLMVPVLLLVVARRADRSRPLAFWALASVVSLMPLVSASPHDRLLCLAGACLWMVTAEVVIHLWRIRRELVLPVRVVTLGVLALGAFMHLVLSPIALARSIGPGAALTASFDNCRVMAGNQPVTDLAGKALIVVNALDGLHGRMIPWTHERLGLPAPEVLKLLGATPQEVHATRDGPFTLRLYTPLGYLDDDLSKLWRVPSDPLELGESVRVDGYVATVTRRTFDLRPLEVSFRFDHPLDHPGYRFVYWNGLHYTPWPIPPMGRTVLIPHAFAVPR